MKHLKLFEEFSTMNEGAITVYPPGDPYKPEGSIQWTGVLSNIEKWKQKSGMTNLTMLLDIEPDMYTADSQFRSKPLGTWKDKSLPLFSEKHPNYREVEFDFIGSEENEEKPNEPWLRVADKNGLEFLVPPFKIMDIQKGASMRDRIYPDTKYLVDKMRAKVMDYKGGEVYLKMQDGSTKKIPIDAWKKAHYMEIEEQKNEENGENVSESLAE